MDTPSSSETGTESAGSESSSCAAISTEDKLLEYFAARTTSAPTCSRVSGSSSVDSFSMLTPLARAGLRDKLRAEADAGQECNTCHRWLPIEVFTRVTGTRFRNPRCNSCRSRRHALTPLALAKKKLLDDGRRKPCADCGGMFDLVAMDYDYVRGTKRYNLGSAYRWVSLAALAAEIEKCDVVCSNCHRVRTEKRGWKGGRPSTPAILADVERGTAEVQATPRNGDLSTAGRT